MPQMGIAPLLRQKRLMAADFHDLPLFKHNNAIRMDDRREPMGNDHHRPPLPHLDQTFLDFMFRLRVQR